MKAVILAGGKGTRGRPYTDYFPKAMIPVEGRPLIDRIIRYLSRFDFIKEIIIVADFAGLGGQIRNYYHNYYKYNQKYNGKKLSFMQDAQKGTGGDLLHIEKRLGRDRNFVLWFADNLCAIDLPEMRRVFCAKKSAACIATRTSRSEETGFAIVKDGMVKKFMEKPTIKLQMSECLGIYILDRRIIDMIKKKRNNINLSYDILQPLSKEEKISAFDICNSGWIDVESPVVLERNAESVRSIIKQMEC